MLLQCFSIARITEIPHICPGRRFSIHVNELAAGRIHRTHGHVSIRRMPSDAYQVTMSVADDLPMDQLIGTPLLRIIFRVDYNVKIFFRAKLIFLVLLPTLGTPREM